MPRRLATLTGLEPATSAVTGRRANQLRHRALLCDSRVVVACTPYGIRTRATALKGRRPRPLDEGGQAESLRGTRNAVTLGALHSLGYRRPNAQTPTEPAVGTCAGKVSRTVPAPPGRTRRERPKYSFQRAPIAQLVELRTFNPQVPGSSPGGGTARSPTVATVVGQQLDVGHQVFGFDTQPCGGYSNVYGGPFRLASEPIGDRSLAHLKYGRKLLLRASSSPHEGVNPLTDQARCPCLRVGPVISRCGHKRHCTP
jgi:hypothetical protein